MFNAGSEQKSLSSGHHSAAVVNQEEFPFIATGEKLVASSELGGTFLATNNNQISDLFTKADLVITERIQKVVAQRNHIFQEIVQTERTYVQSLENIVAHYIVPLREAAKQNGQEAEKRPIVTAEEMQRLFSNIEVILPVNKLLLSRLEERNEHWDEIDCCGEIFLETTPYLKLYSDYEKASEQSNALMQELLENEEFLDFEYATLPHTNKLTLAALLIMPIQRIPRYRLLLEDLIKHTWTDHPDYESLHKALQAIKTLAQSLNDDIRIHENNTKIQEIGENIKNLPQDFVVPHRLFIQEESIRSLFLIHSKQKLKDVFLYIFNDMLLIVNTTRTKCKGVIEFAQCWMRSLPDTASTFSILELWSPSCFARLYCGTEEKKVNLIDLFSARIDILLQARPVLEAQREALYESMQTKITQSPDFTEKKMFLANFRALADNPSFCLLIFSLNDSYVMLSDSGNHYVDNSGSLSHSEGSIDSSKHNDSSHHVTGSASSIQLNEFLASPDDSDSLDKQIQGRIRKSSASFDFGSTKSISMYFSVRKYSLAPMIGGNGSRETANANIVSFKKGVIKEGELVKQGGSIKSWKRRWFVLETNGHLYYYKDRMATKPLGDILLQNVVVAKLSLFTCGRKNCFQIATRRTLQREGRDYLIVADTEMDCDEWVSALNESLLTRPTHSFKSGWLLKRENKWSKWRQRWWVIDEHNISYYKHDKDDVPSGTIPLLGTVVKSLSEDQKYSFSLTNGHKVYYIAAQDQEDYDAWVEVISFAKTSKKFL